MTPQDPPLPTQPVSVPRPGGAISPLTADEAQVADLEASFHTDSAPQRSLAIIILLIGGWQMLLATAAIMSTLLWWPAVDAAAAGAVGLGPLTLTAATGILLLGVVGGVAGSLVHTITIFSSRVGRSTLEASYLWWYLLRPFGAALLALIFVATMMSGMVALGGDSGVARGTMAFVGGGLAGLFTDAVLQKLRGILGATSTEKMASQQALPLAPPPA